MVGANGTRNWVAMPGFEAGFSPLEDLAPASAVTRKSQPVHTRLCRDRLQSKMLSTALCTPLRTLNHGAERARRRLGDAHIRFN